jgi:hypothetical protein
MTTADPAPIRTAPLDLWRIAAAFLAAIHALFGGPERVAFQHTLTAKAHGQLAAWLRCAEAMLRRLLLIEAAAYPKPNTRPLLAPPRPRARKLMSFTPDEPEKWRVSFRCLHLPPRRGGSVDPGRAPGETKGDARAPSDAFGVSSPASGGDKCASAEPVFVFREDRVPRAKTPLRRATRRAERSARRRLLRQDHLWVQYEPKARFRSAWPLAERYEAVLRVFNDPAPYARRLARRLHATPHRLAEALRAPPDAVQRVDRFDEMGECAESRWRLRFSSA